MKRLLLFTFLTFVSIMACKKKEVTQDETSRNEEVSLDKTEALPGDVLTITTPFDITKDFWQIKIGGKDVVISRFDARTAVLVIPYVPAGDIQLDLSELGAGNRTVKILPYSPIANTKAVTDNFISELQLGIDEMQSATDKDLLPVLSSLKQTFQTELAKLSQQEQKELAFMLERLTKNMEEAALRVTTLANLRNSEIEAVNVSSTSDLTFRVSTGENFIAAALQYKRLVVATVACVAGTVFAIYAPDPLSKLFAVGAAAIGIKMLQKSKNQINEVLDLIFHPENFEFANSESTLSVGVETNSSNSNLSENYVDFYFTKDLPAVSTTILSTYTSFTQSLKNETSEAYKSVFKSTDNLLSAYVFVADKVNKIRAFFASTPAMPAYQNPIPQNAKEETAEAVFNKLSLENISDKEMNLTLVKKDGKAVFKVQTNLLSERKFTFDLVHTDNLLGVKTKKTLKAVYNGGNPPDVIKVLSGDLQTGFPNKKLTNPIKIGVYDKDGQALKGVKIIWKVKSGGGTLNTLETVTDEFGSTSNEWVLGTTGYQQLSAVLRKKLGNEVIETETIINAFWNIVGEWEAVNPLIKTTNGVARNMFEWDKPTGAAGRLKDFKLEVNSFSNTIKIFETRQWRDGNGRISETSEEIRMGYDYRFDKGLQVMSFRELIVGSDYAVYKITLNNPSEIAIEHLYRSYYFMNDLYFGVLSSSDGIKLRKIK